MVVDVRECFPEHEASSWAAFFAWHVPKHKYGHWVSYFCAVLGSADCRGLIYRAAGAGAKSLRVFTCPGHAASRARSKRSCFSACLPAFYTQCTRCAWGRRAVYDTNQFAIDHFACHHNPRERRRALGRQDHPVSLSMFLRGAVNDAIQYCCTSHAASRVGHE